MEISFKEGKPGPKWIRKFLRRNKLTMKKTEMINSSRISNTSNPFIIYDFYDALAKVFNESIKYKVHYGYSYSILAMAKPYYTLYYNFMIMIYFYLNQENCKTQGTTAMACEPTTT